MYDLQQFLTEKEKGKLAEFLEYIAFSSTSMLKIERIVERLGLKRKQIQRLIDAVSQTGIIDFVRPFRTKKSYEISSANKIYFVDIGLLNFLLNASHFDKNVIGKINENFAYQQLISNREGMNIYFWRNKNQSEIDFILKDMVTGKLYPLEIKSSNKDTIPKVFFAFYEKYAKYVDYFIKTTKTFLGERRKSYSNKIYSKYLSRKLRKTLDKSLPHKIRHGNYQLGFFRG